MSWRRFEAPVDGGVIVGQLQGEGPPVLLLHGGPALSGEYLEDLAAELVSGYTVTWYQQRSLAPSVETGPFTVAQHVQDIAAVLDALSWPSAWLVGHSWGGHLAVAAAAAIPERLLGIVSVDPLGCVGDGGAAQFEQSLLDRLTSAERDRVRELDEKAMRGEGTVDDVLEGLRLAWPGYYADPATAPAMPARRMSLDGYAGTWASLQEGMPALEATLSSISVPSLFVYGRGSPMPASASADTASRIPGATVDVIEGAGHFVWYERPGAVRAGLDRLVASTVTR